MGSTGGASTGVGGAGGAGGAGGGAVVPEIPGSLASPFSFSSFNDIFDVGDTHIYVLQTKALEGQTKVIRFPKEGGPKEVVYAYPQFDAMYEGQIRAGEFFWVVNNELWSAPLAGGAAKKRTTGSRVFPRQIAATSTEVFVSMGGTTVAKAHLDGQFEGVYSFQGTDPHYDLIADEEAVYLIENQPKRLTRIPHDGGAPQTLITAALGAGLALDALNVYVSIAGVVSRVPKAGGAATSLAPGNAKSIRVDDTHAYWADQATKKNHARR